MSRKKNERCPLQEECERKCAFERRELDCDYYYANARDDLAIEDQEERRREIWRRREEEELAAMEDEEDGEGKSGVLLPVEKRTIEIITEEILFYKQQAGAAILEIGARLNEAKRALSHGEWLAWLEEKVEFSPRTAQRFMKLAEGYEKSDTVTLLGVRKALALLALPESEREEFTAEAHIVNGGLKTAEEMSAEEFERAIRERDEARVRVRELEDSIDEQQKTYGIDMEEAKAALAAAEQDRDKMAADMKFLNERLEGLAGEVEQRKRELEELRSRPVEVAVQEADPAELERAREEGAAAARESAAQELQKAREGLAAAQAREEEATAELARLKKRAAQAEEQVGKAREDAERARKEAQMAGDKDLAAFTVLFEQTQGAVNGMVERLRRMESAGRGEDAAKLRRALEALAGMISGAAKGGG